LTSVEGVAKDKKRRGIFLPALHSLAITIATLGDNLAPAIGMDRRSFLYCFPFPVHERGRLPSMTLDVVETDL